MFVNVVFNLPLREPLTYAVPAKLQAKIHLYQRVEVELQDQRQTALVVSVLSELPRPLQHSGEEIKAVLRVIDAGPVLNQEQVELAEKIAAYYLSAPGETLFTMLPAGRRESRLLPSVGEPLALPPLLPGQKNIVDRVLQGDRGKASIHLLFGVTGSGKTRVYLELMQRYLSAGMGVIFLLPEIALSYQFLALLKPLFGSQMAILHSGLSTGTRFAEYQRVLAGEARLVVGTRSAIFAPVENLGLVILDEEHDSSYKEHSSPRYQTKRVAHLRLEMRQASQAELPLALVLGSATPSVESYYLASQGVFSLHRLSERATGQQMPAIHVIRQQPGANEIFTLFLKDKIKEHLARGRQVMLLLNRRGHSNYAFCPSCEKSLGCPHCSVSLSYHRSDPAAKNESGSLKCHICGHQQSYRSFCPDCGSLLRLVGKGTQKVEEALEKHFPDTVFARLDQDTARLKDYSQEILSAMRENKISILLGTQMIAKGFDLPGVTLVGILNADIGLNLPDFRSSERIFQLLTQAAGRAGRHEAGEVVVQTAEPEHPAVAFFARGQTDDFLRQEIEFRRLLNYPPFCRVLRFLMRGPDESQLAAFASRLSAHLASLRPESQLFAQTGENSLPAEILGPVEAPLYKINNEYRIHLLAKDQSAEKLQALARNLQRYSAQHGRAAGIRVEIDIDPLDIL